MFELVEGLNDREEMLDNLRFLIRYEEKILEDEMIFTKSEFYEELFSTIVMLADDLQKDWKKESPSGLSYLPFLHLYFMLLWKKEQKKELEPSLEILTKFARRKVKSGWIKNLSLFAPKFHWKNEDNAVNYWKKN